MFVVKKKRRYYDNQYTNLKSISDIRNGQIHGKYIEYRITGEKRLEINYINGSKNGVVRNWFIDGRLFDCSYYIRNKPFWNIFIGFRITEGWSSLCKLIIRKKIRRLNLLLKERNKSKFPSGVYLIITSYLTWSDRIKLIQ